MDDWGRQLDGEWINPFSVSTTNSAVSTFPSGDGTAGGDFNFVFTILPGDANLNNDVGGSDYFVYLRNTVGTGHIFIQADYNGDGITNSADRAFWQANYGMNLSSLFVAADFNGDWIVNSSDLRILAANYDDNDPHSHEEGDADLDGDVDWDDYLFLLSQYGLEINVVA